MVYQTPEELAEYEDIIQRTFGSEAEGYEFFNSFAKSKGFSLRKGHVQYLENKDNINSRQLLCSKEGFRSAKNLNREDRQRRPRPMTRFSCSFEVVIKHNPEMNLWFVHKYIDAHNHEMATSKEVGFLFSHRKVTEPQKKEILDYQTAGLRKYQIVDVMEQQYGGNVGHVLRDVYNFCHLNKKAKIANGDANTVLEHMKRRQRRDSEFFFDYQTNAEGRLLNLFWCDAQSRLDYLSFGDLVIFDSTYRTNRYNMPFVPFVGLNHHRSTTIFACGIVSHETVESYEWLLRTFLRAMYQKEPRSIITDGDRAMRRAIRVVLPNSAHRLCAWHIERNAKRYLHHSMVLGFSKLIYLRGTPKSFLAAWKSFLKEHKIGKRNRCWKWLSKMFKIRRLWAATFLKNKYFLGAKSNQRSESLNSRLHRHLDRKMTLYDMVDHYFHCVRRIRRNECELNCIATQSIPVATTGHEVLEYSAAYCFTPANFYLVQREIEMASNYEIMEILDSDVCSTYMIASKEGSNIYYVDCDDETLRDMKCTCAKFETEGLPCCHIMVVLIKLGAAIPQSCVLNRWRRNGQSSSATEEPDNGSSMKRARVTELMELAKQVFEEASSDEYASWKGLLVEKMDLKRKSKDMDDISSHEQEQEDNSEGEEPPINVQDPKEVLCKGAPKRMKSFQDINKPKRQRRCSRCQGTDHDKRNCQKKNVA